MALLDLVNSLRNLLREERVTSVSGSAPDLLVQVDLINRAARRVMTRQPWSFLQRHDGYLFFPARVEAGSAQFTNGITLVVTSLTGVQASAFSDGTVSTKIVRPDDTSFPNTSYRVSDMNSIGVNLTLSSAWRGDTANGASYTIYANEARLPSDVANVLSIRNEEGNSLTFDTLGNMFEFDRMFPYEAERFSSRPDYIAVGSQVVPTQQDGGSVTRGLGVRFFPPNTDDLVLRYSYVKRPETLSSDTDELVGVPDPVQDLVVSFAFQEANEGNVEDNPKKAESLRVSNELALRELADADRRDLGRRYIPRPFGTHSHPELRRFWVTDDTIPSA